MARTILIVARDPNIVYLLQRYVAQSGFQAVITGPGKDAVALAKHVRPAVIVVERDVAEIADCRVLDWLMADDKTCDIPVIMYSILNQEAGEHPAVAGILQKSVRYDEFLAALRQAGVTV